MTPRQLASSNWIVNCKYFPVDNRMLCSRKLVSSSAPLWQPEILYCNRVIWIAEFLLFAYGLFNDTVYITRQTGVNVRVIGEWWIWNVLGGISCGLCEVLSHHLLEERGDWGKSWNTSVTVSRYCNCPRWDSNQAHFLYYMKVWQWSARSMVVCIK